MCLWIGKCHFGTRVQASKKALNGMTFVVFFSNALVHAKFEDEKGGEMSQAFNTKSTVALDIPEKC